MYAIHMGIPEMQKLWKELQRKVKSDKATSKGEKLYKQLF